VKLVLTSQEEIEWSIDRDRFEDDLLDAWHELCTALRAHDPAKLVALNEAADKMRSALRSKFDNVPEVFP